ncbi:uncharacterized protein [Apostichopus japonicus]|uniref:uncharacterized protein isoform X2 n=1 Tax=Stichopus japonicus TaxID=307972 RepID=UPI003AB6004D
MSNFNVTTPNAASGSAISLGGEWTGRDQMEANKYKSTIFQQMRLRQKGKQRKSKNYDNGRPKSTPETSQLYSEGESMSRTPPPKSAPPGSKPRCDRHYEVERKAGRKVLEPHLKIKRSPRVKPDDIHEVIREYPLGSGMTMTKSKSKVAVKINTGLPLDPPPAPRIERVEEQLPADDGHESKMIWRSSSQMSGFSSGMGSLLGASSSSSPHSHTGSSPDRPFSSSGRGTSQESPAVFHNSLSEALIVQLQQQVSDLSLFLGEERLNHKATKEKAAAVMNQKLQELDEKHVQRFQKMQEDYEDKMDVTRQVHEKEKEHQKAASDMQLARMKGELEFLQGAFEAYKKTLVQDMEEKWKKKERDMKHQFQEEMDNALHQQRTELLEQKNVEKKAMSREFQKQMQGLVKEHKKDIEAMVKKFSSASSDVENLRRALDQLKAVREELDQTIEKLALTDEILQDTRQHLQEANLKILNYQDNFQNKVDEVDDKYKERIHQLMQDNTELRKRYMMKCDELFNEKSNTEFKRVEKVTSTKEMLQMIIHAKNRSNVNMAVGDSETINLKQPLIRPFSAPITRGETRSAFINAGEAEHYNDDSQSGDDLSEGRGRPHTTVGGGRKLNRQSLVERSFRAIRDSSLQSL